jgi:hypothetical protein
MAGTVDVNAFIQSLQGEAQPRLIRAATDALDRFSNHVLGEAQKITPVDTGALVGSATAEDAVVADGKISQTIGFDTDYAAAVHERLDLHHKPPTQAKFLETVMRANADKLGVYVQSAVNKELG